MLVEFADSSTHTHTHTLARCNVLLSLRYRLATVAVAVASDSVMHPVNSHRDVNVETLSTLAPHVFIYRRSTAAHTRARPQHFEYQTLADELIENLFRHKVCEMCTRCEWRCICGAHAGCATSSPHAAAAKRRINSCRSPIKYLLRKL